MNHQLQESVDLVEATAATDESGLLEVDFISPGWGASGYYSRQVLEAAAPIFAAGTQMYLDHPHADGSGMDERGNRSVRDLAAVIHEAGHIDKATGAIRGKVRPLAPYRELLTDEAFAKNVGLSMRASATDITEGEAEGKRGLIIEGLTDLKSVDFVTRAGRGGRVRQILESAASSQPEDVTARAIAHGVQEATADERRQQLSDAVRSAYGTDRRWAYVRDFDDSVVWFEASSDGEPTATYEQSYDVDDGDLGVTLSGDRRKVRAVTRYLPTETATTESAPATRPGSNTATESTGGHAMPKIEIDESEHQRLVTEAGRVTALESELATEKARGDKAEGDLAESRRTSRARELITESKTTFDRWQTAGLMADLPLTEEGALDEEAFTKRVTESAAELAEAHGAGQITGYGGESHGIGDDDPAKLREESDKVRRGAFGRDVNESKGA